MIDSMNPRILANNIRELFKKINSITPGTDVEGNPSGPGYNTLLTKIKIGTHKYKLPLDVTANPEGAATVKLEKLGVGGTIYNTDAAFVDTANVIQAKTTYSGSLTYTATADCYVIVSYAANTNTEAGISVNGVLLDSIFTSSGIIQRYACVLLKAGQTLTATSTFSEASVDYTVYGI